MSSGYLTLWIETAITRYPVYIGKQLQPLSILDDGYAFDRALVVTDDIVAKNHLSTLSHCLLNHDVKSMIIGHGEENKTISELSSILDELVKKDFHRDDLVIAFGGGMVGDMAGLAASLFHRGARLWQFPTTLLAQVDAAVGGKTAINYGGEKNCVGTFYQPEAVFCDIAFLQTLSERAYLSALAEVIKYALLESKDFFDFLCDKTQQLITRDEQVLQQVVAHCCQIKARIVSQDEKEQGMRAVLNLGHTFAHAIESCTQYKQYFHGEAVAVGLVLAAKLSHQLGYLKADSVELIIKLLQKLKLPVTLSSEIDSDSLLSLMKRDKKVRQSKVRFVLLNNIGEAFVDTVSDEGLVRGVLSEVKGSL